MGILSKVSHCRVCECSKVSHYRVCECSVHRLMIVIPPDELEFIKGSDYPVTRGYWYELLGVMGLNCSNHKPHSHL